MYARSLYRLYSIGRVQVRLEPSPGCPPPLKVFNRHSAYIQMLYSILCLSPPTYADYEVNERSEFYSPKEGNENNE